MSEAPHALARPTPRRHAEIAGAGLGGLTAAAALAHRGWSVRVHERHASLRVEGFGITLLENGLRVLEAVGAFAGAVEDGHPANHRVNRAHDGRLVSSHIRPGRSYRVTRQRLVTALAETATRLGVDIVYNSTVRAATPDGTLILDDGTQLKADLVVAADGVNSPIREGLGLLRRRVYQNTGAIRVLIPRLPGDISEADAEVSTEWWSPRRRINVAPCSSKEIYAALVCDVGDTAGRRMPFDAEGWAAEFPPMRKFIERMRDIDWTYVQWAPFQVVKLKRWSAGRVAIIGDAAHAMPPNLGQGGGGAMMTGLSLAHAMDQDADPLAALAQWERRERPLIEHTQRWSVLYGHLSRMPKPVRDTALWIINRQPTLRRSFQATASHHPAGADDTLSWPRHAAMP